MRWQVHQVGTLGFLSMVSCDPSSILVGQTSYVPYHDHVLKGWFASDAWVCSVYLILLILLVRQPVTGTRANVLAVSPQRYIVGYFLACTSSIQTFEGVIGSDLEWHT
jgi:hypothetical protein